MQAKEGGGEMGCAIGRQMILLLRLGGEEVTLQSQLRSSLDQTLCRVNAALRSSGRSRFWGYAVSLMHHRANKAGAEPAAPRAVTSEGTPQGPYRVSWPSLDGHACTRGSCLLVRVELWGEAAGAADLTFTTAALEEILLKAGLHLVVMGSRSEATGLSMAVSTPRPCVPIWASTYIFRSQPCHLKAMFCLPGPTGIKTKLYLLFSWQLPQFVWFGYMHWLVGNTKGQLHQLCGWDLMKLFHIVL